MSFTANEWIPGKTGLNVSSTREQTNTPILPRGHGTKLKFHQSQCGNLCSCLELPLSNISEQMAWEKLNHLANNFPPRKVFWLYQGPPPIQTSFKKTNTRIRTYPHHAN